MTKTIITTVTKPDGTTSTTTETFLYPAMMKDASVQTIELYEPCDYVPTKQQKKEGKKTGQKERTKTEQKEGKKPEEKKENNEKKPQQKEEKKKATSKPKKEEKKEEKKTEMQEEKTPISRVEAVLKKTKS